MNDFGITGKARARKLPALIVATLVASCAPSLDSLEQRLQAPRPCESADDCRALQERAHKLMAECEKNLTWYREQSRETDCSRERRVYMRADAAYRSVAEPEASSISDRRNRAIPAPRAEASTAYETGQDPSDCANYEKLSLIAVVEYPNSDTDWTDQHVQSFKVACPRYESMQTLVFAAYSLLPPAAASQPKEACVAPYLKRGQAACAVAGTKAKLAAARLEAERARRDAAAATAAATQQPNALKGSLQQCMDSCDSAPPGSGCLKRCADASIACNDCCHLKNPTSTSEHCAAVCRRNLTAFVCK